MEEVLSDVKLKKVVFKRNTQEQLGVNVSLTKDREYEVLSIKIPEQHEVTPSVDNIILYLIKDDTGEKRYFFSNYFVDKASDSEH